MQGKIVRHLTKDGIYLNGLYQERKSDKAIFYTHGWSGDFYCNPFYDFLYGAAEKLNYGFLITQNRGSGNTYDFLTKEGKEKTIGAVHEKFDECILDFEAWLYFLYLKGYKEVTLVGHSFACHKIAYFSRVIQHPMVTKIILLSPFDIFDLFETELHQDREALSANLKLAQKMIEEGKGQILMPEDSLWFPISAFGFYDHFGPESKLHIFDFNSQKEFKTEILKNILTPALVILGANDPYVRNHESFLKNIQQAIPVCETVLIKGANHSYQGKEKDLEEAILRWMKKIETG